MKIFHWPWLVAMFLLPVGSASADHLKELAALVAAKLPSIDTATARPSPVEGIYEIRFDGGVVYASHDAKFVFGGPLLNIDTKENLTENVQRGMRQDALASAKEDTMIIFEPAGKTRYTITTFTDIDCGYCRKMHSEITDLMDAGIRVRYMLFPRAGVGSDSHRKAVAVWCADDQRTAITAAKAGRDPGAASCSNPIESHMKIGRQLGLRGTPFSLTDTGEPINGYMPAKAMLEKLASGR